MDFKYNNYCLFVMHSAEAEIPNDRLSYGALPIHFFTPVPGDGAFLPDSLLSYLPFICEICTFH
jgi:hypothetical protein